ncbi:MAG: EAL domain-containing protein [Nitrospiria bacterium]
MQAFPDLSDSTDVEAQAPVHRKWHRIYYLLAIFDLLTISLTVYLNHQVMEIYTNSLEVNQEWAERLNRYSDLRQLSIEINAPGNNIFESGNLLLEAKQLQDQILLFDQEMASAKEDLTRLVQVADMNRLLNDLNEVDAAMDRMTANTKEVFFHYAKGEIEEATRHMALMDRELAYVNQTFSQLFGHVNDIQKIHFEEQLRAASLLQKFEFMIAACILMMVGGATFYGKKLSKQAEEDARERERHLKAVRSSEERFLMVARATNDAIWDRNIVTQKMEWNRGIEVLFKYPLETVGGDVIWWENQIHEADRKRVVSEIADAIEGGDTSWTIEYRFKRCDASYADVFERGYIARDDHGCPIRMIAAMMDMTERNLAQRRLKREQSFVKLLQLVTVAANEASTVEKAMQVVVDQVCEHTGWSIGHVYLMSPADGTELYSTDIWHLENPTHFQPFRDITEQTRFASGIGLPGRVLSEKKLCWVRYEGVDTALPRSKHLVETGVKVGFAFPVWIGKEIVGVLEFFSTDGMELDDPLSEVISQIGTLLGRVVERKRAEERLQFSAHYDPLTGLPNRILFRDRLEQAMIRSRWPNKLVGLLFLDLDRFKVINDTLGHGMGDLLLQAVTKRLERCVREGDTVSRFGGDEFTIILSDVAQTEDLVRIAKKVLESISSPYYLEGHELFVSTSIGITVYPEDGKDQKELLKNADIAMYLAKEKGRNVFQFYSPEMDTRTVERLALENSLRYAVERDELFLEYQPQVDLVTGTVIGMEALVRWNHPDLGLIPPDKFIPLAEETGLIIQIGDWVLRTACEQAKIWQEGGFSKTTIAVNLSARQLQTQQFVKNVVELLKEIDLDPHRLELELTESILIRNQEALIVQLHELSAIGIQLSIDDFGTGYSSLSYLKRFPINRLKVDKSFVRSVPDDQNDAGIVKAVVAMGHSLNLRVVAEGVETNEQMAFLQSIACDEIQGYVISRPISGNDASKFLNNTGLIALEGGMCGNSKSSE